MIRFFLLLNRSGKSRLAKYYTPLSDDEKKRLEDEVYRLITNRDSKFTNFVEVGGEGECPSLPCHAGPTSHQARPHMHSAPPPGWPLARVQFKTYKLVYRRYAGLYFVFGVDPADNELLYLESIHLFVEASPMGGDGC